ncbi:MAG: S8/S53 family peptidase [Flavobacteriales bacterium]|nr:S8/S53 family peptidase [Flavobacteriales bacterium]
MKTDLRPITFWCIILLCISCAKEQIEPLGSHVSSDQRSLLDRSEMDEIIRAQMGERDLFYWKNVDARYIWSAAMQSDQLLSVGFCINGEKDISQEIHRIDMSQAEWRAAKTELLEMVLDIEREARGEAELSAADILPPHLNSGEWPNFFFQVSDLRTVEALRSHPNVRYVEPTGYHLAQQAQRSDSGCSNEPDHGINAEDYIIDDLGVKIPWNYPLHNIPTAWNTSSGNGIRIGVLDTGISSDQDNLGENFNSGYSEGRSVQRLSTKWSGALWWADLDSPEDDCGHGTSMSGVACGPWSDDGNALGVAYNADLLSIRAVEDVVITTSNESAGVRDALKVAGKRSSVKVISMSIGDPFYNSTVADGVYYAHNEGDIILCAAGTSFSITTWYGVVFPATMEETLAVTGVTDASSPQKCASCHDGSEVDFTIIMERQSDSDRHPISLAMHSDQPSYIGGSSVATSTLAGITALVWSAHPGDTREQIIHRIKLASEHYPDRHPDFGWGRVDAAAAVQVNQFPVLLK